MSQAVWIPQNPTTCNMWRFMQFIATNYQISIQDYNSLHTWSVQNPEQFWPALCDFFKIDFATAPTQILHKDSMLDSSWFTGATFNFTEKLLSKCDDSPALINISEDGSKYTLSYRELHKLVMQSASSLHNKGIKAGDRIVAIMPNTAQTIIAMLATTSIGAIWSSCSPEFGAAAIIDRFAQIAPKLLFICDSYTYRGKNYETLSKIASITRAISSIEDIVVCNITTHDAGAINNAQASWRRDVKAAIITWDDFIKTEDTIKLTPYDFSHPVYIMFSSGTTGKPKCIVHGAGGTLLQHIKELGLHTDIKPKDNILFYTTCGWMMWNWMVSSLAIGATITLYDGAPNYPDTRRLFQIVAQENITVLGTSAKFLAEVEKSGVTIGEMQHLRCILSTGSPLLPPQYDFVNQHIKAGVQLCSISGGTDIISCFALGNPLLPVYRGELQCLGLGMAVAVFNEQGHAIIGECGELVCTQPFPSMPIGFWNDPDKTRYKQSYFTRFPNTWAHGDFAEITAHHGLIIYGRSDAVLNPGGVRIGTAEIYRQLENIPEIQDSVVIGQQWQGDERIILFVKLCANIPLDEKIKTTIRQTIKNHASPRHVPAKILQVADIPRTFNGKILELAVRQTVQGAPIKNLQAIANPESLAYFTDRVELCD